MASGFPVENGEEGVDDGDDGDEVPYIERHGRKAAGAALGKFISKVGEGQPVLVERHPEEDDDGKDQEQGQHALFGLLGGEGVHNLLLLSLGMAAFDMTEPAPEGIVDGDRDNQGHARHGKGEMVGGIAVEAQSDGPFTNLDGRCRGEKGADVDGHVEERETAVPLGGILGIVVQVTDHHLEVALEQAGAEADQQQGREHAHEGDGAASERNGKEQVAQEHDEDAGRDHLPETEFVGEDTADQREEIDQHQERAVNGSGGSGGEAEVRPEEKGEDGDHRVVAEALAGIGECEGEETFGLSFEHIFDF